MSLTPPTSGEVLVALRGSLVAGAFALSEVIVLDAPSFERAVAIQRAISELLS